MMMEQAGLKSITPEKHIHQTKHCTLSAKFEDGVCCQTTGDIESNNDAVLDEISAPGRPPRWRTAADDGADEDSLLFLPIGNNRTINHDRKIHKRAILDYEQLFGINTTDYGIYSITNHRRKRCIIGPRCRDEHLRYRRFDGRCNNIGPGQSLWGSAGYPMERILPPAYGDRVASARTLARSGKLLPSARKVSAHLFDDMHVPDKHLNVLMMQFGQFIVHDITKSKSAAEKVECCLHGGKLASSNLHVACFPISVSANDPFYSRFGVRCMEFLRTATVPKHRCQAGHDRQISSVTHFIDGSGIYGNSASESHSLRSHVGGRLKSLVHHQLKNELPPLETTTNACRISADMCFKVGDDRVNQIITLVAVHTLFLREHNRIADFLHRLNPHWNDEIIFQETRRIIGAELQHIVFNEYLPKVVGPRFMKKYNLHAPKGHSKFYNSAINPSITSEFSAAAFRFGHSTIPGQLELPKGVLDTHKTFFNPSLMSDPEFFDRLFQGILAQPMQKVDDKFSHSISWFLNSQEGKQFGKDLVSINIQRGRDHAVRPYNHYLRLSGKHMKLDFKDFDSKIGSKLHQIYDSPEDVDLFVGGILEHPVEGGIVGETFAEIISDQFSRLQQGDRYFYSNGEQTNPGHFTKLQIDELQKVTLAGILCANMNNQNNFDVPLHAFNLPHSNHNPLVPCKSNKIHKIDLRWWKD
ncbi:chorion peroxidase-like [Sabethes cyaneus]|uniref:chorion peroxidase-like n=1 Tax=Sabethes cyaneus TaxID=53552 RepID=UPI00237E3813|nr:chorion peroxidase-like [Sabethes cyaneus]